MLTPIQATYRAALIVVALTFFLNLMSRLGDTFAVFLLPIESAFKWNRATLSTIYGLYMGAHGVGGILVGWLVDRIGPRPSMRRVVALLRRVLSHPICHRAVASLCDHRRCCRRRDDINRNDNRNRASRRVV